MEASASTQLQMSELISKDNHLSCCVFMQRCCRFVASDLMKSKITSNPPVRSMEAECATNMSLNRKREGCYFHKHGSLWNE